MNRIAVISAILENPTQSQEEFNDVVSHYKGIVRGRIGLPYDDEDIGVIALSVLGDEMDIERLSKELTGLPNVTLSTVYAKRELSE